MTAPATAPGRPQPPGVRPGRDGFARVLRAEWTKLRSVRSTAWCVLLAIGLTVLLSMLAAVGGSTDANNFPRFVDQLHFVHQPLSGDGTIVARVRDQRDTDEWARAGILLKRDVRPGSPYAAIMLTPRHGVRLQTGFSTEVAGGDARAPSWLRLIRSGGTITGQRSADGRAWTTVGTARVGGLPARVEVGLFVNSPGVHIVRRGTSTGPVNEPGTATFDNVSVTRTAPTAPSTPGATASPGSPANPSSPASPGTPGGGGAPPGEPGRWKGDQIGGEIRNVDGTVAAQGFTQAGGTFKVTGAGDLRALRPGEPGDDDIVKNGLSGVYIGLIAAVVLGVLFMTSEFKNSVLRTTFAASPRRGRVLAAKTIVLGGLALAAGLVASFTAFLVTQPLLRGGGFRPPAYPHPSLADEPVLRAVVGTALFIALMALFGLGLGAILRRSAGAITFAIALVVVPAIAASFLPIEAEQWVHRLTPLAGLEIQQTRDRFDVAIGPWAGLGVLCAYVAVTLGVAGWLLRRRDS